MPQTPEHEVVIIGAGFGGLGAGIALKGAGMEDFVILERADDIGGTCERPPDRSSNGSALAHARVEQLS